MILRLSMFKTKLLQDAQSKWANTLWAELDVGVLTSGVEAFLQRLKRLPKDLQQTHPFKSLLEKVNSFKDSIPLFADLKVLFLFPRFDLTLKFNFRTKLYVLATGKH